MACIQEHVSLDSHRLAARAGGLRNDRAANRTIIVTDPNSTTGHCDKLDGTDTDPVAARAEVPDAHMDTFPYSHTMAHANTTTRADSDAVAIASASSRFGRYYSLRRTPRT
jgi:hypothetical protein